jgi:hypothetical protein
MVFPFLPLYWKVYWFSAGLLLFSPRVDFIFITTANYISKKDDLFASFRLTEDDEREIRRLARDERIGSKIVQVCKGPLMPI